MMHYVQHDDEDSENEMGIYGGSSIQHWTGQRPHYLVLVIHLTHLLRAARRFILSYFGSGKSDTVVAGGCANGVVVFAFE